MQEQEKSLWERLKETNVEFTETGKATVATLALAPALTEGLMHLGNAGIGLSGGLVLFSFLHGDKFFRAGRWLKEKIVADNPNFGERFKEQKEPDQRLGKSILKASDSKLDVSILLGIDKRGREVRRSIEQLKSLIILGVPGKGKTSTAAWIISQYVALGAELVILDRNAKSEEGLAYKLAPFERAFVASPAMNPKQMLEALEVASDRLQARMDKEEKSDHPLLLIIDEATDLFAKAKSDGEWKLVAKRAMEIVEEFNAMGRKFQCFAICIGQLTNASRTGGTEIRELFATRIVHGMKASQAAMILPRHLIEEAPRLERGEAFLDTEGTEDPFKIKIPYLSFQMAREIAKSLPVRAQKTTILPEMEMEMMMRNVQTHDMHGDAYSHFRAMETENASPDQELVNYLLDSGKCPDAAVLAQEQMLRFASCSEDRSLSQIAKDWGFEGGRPWQRVTALLKDLKAQC